MIVFVSNEELPLDAFYCRRTIRMDENRSDGLFILWRSHDRAFRGLEGAGFCHQQVPNFEIQLCVGGDPEIDLSLIEMKPAHLVKRKEAVLPHLYI